MTFLRYTVGTIIGPIGVHVASELIIAVSAAAAAKVQSKVGCGFEILEDSFRGSVMAGERHQQNVKWFGSHNSMTQLF
jgi:hypothetical protein